jgi:hypothetical protein
MKRLIICATLALAACTPHPTTPGTTPPVQQVVDKVVIEGTRGLILAELGYESAATLALDLINAGVIKGETAAKVRDLNATITGLLVKAKATTDAAQRAALVAQALDQTFKLQALTIGAGQ